jgi:hypothetical protein
MNPHRADALERRNRRGGGSPAEPLSLLGILLLVGLLLSSAGVGGFRGGSPASLGPTPSAATASPHPSSASPTPAAGSNYTVTFSESGLPSGTTWFANVSGSAIGGKIYNQSSGSEMNFSIPNGSYSFGIATLGDRSPSPGYGNFTVSGSNLVRPITFLPPPPSQYIVTFTQTGMPLNYSSFVVIFNGTLYQTQTASISVRAYNGTYSYGVGQSGIYIPTPGYGNLTVSGSDLVVPVSLSPPTSTTYPVTFNETGLAPGTLFQVYSNGGGGQSYSNTVVINMTNGTYPFLLVAGAEPTGYVSPESPGNVTVNGSAVTLNVTFIATPYLLTFAESGLPTNTVFSAWIYGVGGTGQAGVGSFPIDVINGSYSYWIPPVWGYVPVNATGNVTIQGASVTVSVAFVPEVYDETFTESGLPPGTNWTVDVDGSEGLTRTSASLTFPIGNGTYGFNVFPETGFVTSPTNGTFTIIGANGTIAVVFSTTANLPHYWVTFSESGLPIGSNWTVLMQGVAFNETYLASSGTQIQFDLLNATYWYAIYAPPDYSAVDYLEYFTVNGQDLSIAVVFFDVAENAYPVTFDAFGLPGGVFWSVSLDGANTSGYGDSLYFTAPNGTYNYSATPHDFPAPNPSSGQVVINGAGVVVDVIFGNGSAGPFYALLFSETGLPAGTNWSVELWSGSAKYSVTSSIQFALPNGTFNYTVSPILGERAAPSSGQAVVAGARVTVSIVFTSTSPRPTTYSVEFVEQGLPTGTSWSVDLGGTTVASTTTTVQFNETNGTYAFTLSTVSGFTANSTGQITVSGTAVTWNLTFSNTTGATYAVQFVESTLPSGDGWQVLATNAATGERFGQDTRGSELTLELPNGTYSLTASGPSGYEVSLSVSQLKVTGPRSVDVTVSFTEVCPCGGVPVGSSGATSELWVIGGVVGALAVVGVVALTLRSRRPPPAPPDVA